MMRLQLALHASCATCGRNVGNRSRDDVVEAVVFGTAGPYAICPACFQKPLGGGADADYQRRARVVLFERYGIVVRKRFGEFTHPVGVPCRAVTACPECGGELQRTRIGVAPAGSHESEAREVDVLACTECEHIEEEG